MAEDEAVAAIAIVGRLEDFAAATQRRGRVPAARRSRGHGSAALSLGE